MDQTRIQEAETIVDASRDDIARLIDQEGWIRGAGVEAHRIAALVGGGMKTGEVLADYPNLEAAQVEAAVRFAAKSPDARQFPTVTAKSVLRHGGGGGLAKAFAAAREDEQEE